MNTCMLCKKACGWTNSVAAPEAFSPERVCYTCIRILNAKVAWTNRQLGFKLDKTCLLHGEMDSKIKKGA